MTGSELRTARKKLGLSQVALAARWGLDRRSIIRWEQGKWMPGWVRDALIGVRHTYRRKRRRRKNK